MISMQWVGYKYLVNSFGYPNSQLQKKQAFFFFVLNSQLTFESWQSSVPANKASSPLQTRFYVNSAVEKKECLLCKHMVKSVIPSKKYFCVTLFYSVHFQSSPLAPYMLCYKEHWYCPFDTSSRKLLWSLQMGVTQGRVESQQDVSQTSRHHRGQRPQGLFQ